MPALFAVVVTAAHVVGYAVLFLLLASIVMPVLAGVCIAIAYAVMVYRGAVSWITDDDENEEVI